MFEEKTLDAPKKSLAIASLIIALLCIALIVVGQIINLYNSRAFYESEREIVAHLSTAIMIALAAFAPLGLILSFIALVKAGRKPTLYGGKALSVIALVICIPLSLIAVWTLLILVSYAV